VAQNFTGGECHLNRIEERFPRLWAVLERLSVIVFSSLLFWVFCLPVALIGLLDFLVDSAWITVPAGILAVLLCVPQALVGLFYGTVGLVRPAQGETLGRFWRGFRRTYLTAAGLGALNLVVAGILFVDIRFFWVLGTWWSQVIASVFGSLAVVQILANIYAWPLLAWYPQPLMQLVRRAVLLTAAHPILGLSAVLSVFVFIVSFLFAVPSGLMGLLPAIGPGMISVLISLYAWRAMKRYAEEEVLE